MIQILITGAKGFIGSELTNHLQRRGYLITGCSYDLNDIDNIEKLFIENKPKIVIHLAAKVDKTRPGRENDDFFQVNVMGTLNIVRLCEKYGAKLIYFSSSSADFAYTKYGNKYRISKALAENLIKAFTINQDLRAVVVRPCAVYKTIFSHPEGYITVDRFGKQENVWIGEWYSTYKLCKLVERIIKKESFKKYKVYKTKTFWHYVWWGYGKVKSMVRRIVGKNNSSLLL